jgi:hypothetical protein
MRAFHTRSDQSATLGLSLPAVHIRPENYKIVHLCGSHRPGTTTLWSSSPPSGLCPPRDRTLPCPGPSPEPDSCRTPGRTGSVKVGFACT